MEIGDRVVVVSSAEGKPLLRLKAMYAAAIAAAAIITAPRATAALALGALFKGVTLEVEPEPALGDEPV